MTIPHKLVAMIMLIVFTTMSIEAQESDTQDDSKHSTAYHQTSQVALWSAYAVIAVFVATAVAFGIADGDTSGDGKGLGSPARSSSKHHSYSSKKYSKGSHSH